MALWKEGKNDGQSVLKKAVDDRKMNECEKSLRVAQGRNAILDKYRKKSVKELDRNCQHSCCIAIESKHYYDY